MSKEIAQTILSQLGGKAFIAMTGAKSFVYDGASLSFRIPVTRKINRVTIALDASDTYTVTFSYQADVRKMFEITERSKHEGIYCDMLRDLFTEETGLYTSLR